MKHLILPPVGILLLSTIAQAQTATTTATTTTGMGLPGPQATASAGESDHDMMVGTFGIGYLGRRSLGLGANPVSPASVVTTPALTLEAPVIGARVWLTPMLGIDAGIGLAIVDDGKGKHKIDPAPAGTPAEEEANLAPLAGFLFHAGVPLALSNHGHFSFQVIPELNFGYASQKIEVTVPGTTTTTTSSGLTFDVGARGGAEIHFGFIGIPQLSLQGSVGVLYRMNRLERKVEVEAAGVPPAVTTDTVTVGNFGTTVYDNPWNIFQSNVAALYYF